MTAFHCVDDHDLPVRVEQSLGLATVLCGAFNRPGTMLATGSKEGRIALWDFYTRRHLKVQQCSGAVLCLAWSGSGRHVLAATNEQKLILWSILDDKLSVHPCECSSPLVRLEFHRALPLVVLVTPQNEAPLRVDLGTEQATTRALASVIIGTIGPSQLNTGGNQLVDSKRANGSHNTRQAPENASRASRRHGVKVELIHQAAGAVYDHSSEHILLGQGDGRIAVYKDEDLTVLDVIDVCGGVEPAVGITDMVLTPSGSHLAVMGENKWVRVCRMKCGQQEARPGLTARELETAVSELSLPLPAGQSILSPEVPFLEVCPHMSWDCKDGSCSWGQMHFMAGGRRLVISSRSKKQHRVNVWDRRLGKLLCALCIPPEEVGPNQSVRQCCTHPTSPVLLTISSKSGQVLIWAPMYLGQYTDLLATYEPIIWSKPYEEREDEFDWRNRVEERASIVPPPEGADEEDVPVDIRTRQLAGVLLGPGGEPYLMHLPVVLKQEEKEGEEEEEEEKPRPSEQLLDTSEVEVTPSEHVKVAGAKQQEGGSRPGALGAKKRIRKSAGAGEEGATKRKKGK